MYGAPPEGAFSRRSLVEYVLPRKRICSLFLPHLVGAAEGHTSSTGSLVQYCSLLLELCLSIPSPPRPLNESPRISAGTPLCTSGLSLSVRFTCRSLDVLLHESLHRLSIEMLLLVLTPYAAFSLRLACHHVLAVSFQKFRVYSIAWPARGAAACHLVASHIDCQWVTLLYWYRGSCLCAFPVFPSFVFNSRRVRDWLEAGLA